MGLCYSQVGFEDSDNSKRKWKPIQAEAEALFTYEGEGTINGNSSKDQLEFRALLDYPITIEFLEVYIGNEAASYMQSFSGWIKIRQYNELPKYFDKLGMAQSMFVEYFRGNVHLDEQIRGKLAQRIQEGAANPDRLVGAFDMIYVKLFLLLFCHVYAPFKECPEFRKLRSQINGIYNTVLSKDFEYIGVIGKGGFGLVCDVRKKSTGERYAMKIQSKEGVVNSFGSESWRACLEMRAFASCKHPFIVELCCAYQTESLLILVMTLGTWCDLSKVVKMGGPLSISHVRFYSAEIVSALGYLHSKHFVYRDLKPANVLLNADGHIQLVDFGAVCDLEGRLLKKCSIAAMPELPLFSDDGSQYSAHNTISHDSSMMQEENVTLEPISKRRAKSLVGTYGYMAPEMVVMLGEESRINSGYDEARLARGYTKAVDWWGLGVLVYKMVVGQYPFRCGQDKTAIPTWEILSEPVNYDVPALKGEPEAVDFISSLLVVDDTKRLGADPKGVTEVRSHVFFAQVDWRLLENRRMAPPSLPNVNIPQAGSHARQKARYVSLENLLEVQKRTSWFAFGSSPEQIALQHHFGSWDYTSASLITQELDFISSRSRERSRSKTAAASIISFGLSKLQS